MKKIFVCAAVLLVITAIFLSGCGSVDVAPTYRADDGIPVSPKVPFRTYEMTEEGLYQEDLSFTYADDRETTVTPSGTLIFKECDGSILLLSNASMPVVENDTMRESITNSVRAGVSVEDINAGIVEETTMPFANSCQFTIDTHGITVKNDIEAVWFGGTLIRSDDIETEAEEPAQTQEYYTCGYLFYTGEQSYILAGIATKEGRDKYATAAIIQEIDQIMDSINTAAIEQN